MTGWIIYSIKDVEKNKGYIQMYVDRFKDYNVRIDLIILEKINCWACYINDNKPDFAINRSRNADLSVALENAGIRVFNHSSVTKIANDKGRTYDFLKDTVPFLPVKYDNKIIESQIESNNFSYPFVVKSCGGHGGSQVFMVSNKKEEKWAMQTLENENYVVQQCCSDLGKDVRVYIIGNEIVAAVLRTSPNSFKSNYSLGGKAEQYCLNDREQAMVKSIVQKLPLDYAGIDFTFHNGEAVFNEIEDAVGARMLYQTSDIDIVSLFIEYIMQELKR